MPDCNHDCSECSLDCPSRQDPQSFQLKPHELSNIKKVIAVVSGKGGVGKSLTTSLLAVEAMRQGKKVAIIDADVTGPSIPKIFGLTEMATGSETAIFPVLTKTGIETISINLLMDDPTSPVVWRGPVISGLVKQFWTDVAYGDIDELYVDMPPGTGDVPLTVFQSLPVDGIVIVTSPQDLVTLIVEKAMKMAELMHIPVLGVVENMAYLRCPHCNEVIYPYGKHSEDIVKRYDIPAYCELPIDPRLAKACDEGAIEDVEETYIKPIALEIDRIEK